MGESECLGVFDTEMDVVESKVIAITEPNHPIADGVGTGRVTFTTDTTPSANVGQATADATVIASVGSNDSAVVLPAGAQTSAGQPAAGCRIALPMFKDGTSANLTRAGQTLFSNAVEHGAANCPGDTP